MIRRTAYKGDTTRWALDPNKQVSYEFQFQGGIVTPGMELRIRDDRAVYKFLCLVYDSKLDKTWLELSCVMGFRAKTIDKVTKVIGLKKTKRKKAMAE
jgi:hypothetical protein